MIVNSIDEKIPGIVVTDEIRILKARVPAVLGRPAGTFLDRNIAFAEAAVASRDREVSRRRIDRATERGVALVG